MGRFVTTSTPLLANAVWTSGIIEPRGADRLTGSVFADQNGTLWIEQAGDLVYGPVTTLGQPGAVTADWDIQTNYQVTAGDGEGISEEILLPFVRIRFVNGPVNQTVFRLRAQTQSAGGK